MSKNSEPTTAQTAGESPFTIVFARHGQAGGPEISEVLGMPLTELGRQQAARLAIRLHKERIDQIYTSNLSRAYETAQEVLKYHKNTPCTVMSDLREVTHYHFCPGLSPKELMIRKCVREEKKAMRRFVDHIMREHKPGDRICVVAHGNLIRALIPMFGSRDPKKCVLMDMSNTAVSILDVWSAGEAILRLANCTRHLIPRQVT